MGRVVGVRDFLGDLFLAMNLILGSGGFIGKALANRIDAELVKTSSVGPRLDKDHEWLPLRGVDTVYLCAGRTGGVGRMAGDPFSFILPNVRIHMNVFESCQKAGVRKVVCLQSTTGYPSTSEMVSEDQYLDGEVHDAYYAPGNANRFIYRISKLFDFDTVFLRPSNVYGPGNNFDPTTSHVIEATVRKVVEKQDPFVIWGTGKEVRDAIYIDDLVEAMATDLPAGAYNVGTGTEMNVDEMVGVLLNHADFHPEVRHDLSKPTAIPARRVNCDKLRSFGWTPKVSMPEGLKRTLDWYRTQSSHGCPLK